jgi:regulator of RNase E activity RraA
MTPYATLTPTVLAKLRVLDTCSVSNAIERTQVRLRNEGFVHGTAQCLLPRLKPAMLGYAVTAVVRTSAQPVRGGWYYDRIDWWKNFLAVPAPRVMVLQDADEVPALGAFVGAVHANIAAALDCVGCVTNGAIRDLTALEALGFHAFAAGLSPSHAYAHVIDWGAEVEVGGLRIAPGDLVHGDLHGVQTIPISIAPDLPAIVEDIDREERELFALCRSSAFSTDALAEMFARFRVSVSEPSPSRPSGKSS